MSSPTIPAGFRELNVGEKIAVGDCFIDTISGHLVPTPLVGACYGPYVKGVTAVGHCTHVRAVVASAPAEAPWRDVTTSDAPGEKDFPVWVHCVADRHSSVNGIHLVDTLVNYGWMRANITHWKPAKADVPTAPRILTQAEKDEQAFQKALEAYGAQTKETSSKRFLFNYALRHARTTPVSASAK